MQLKPGTRLRSSVCTTEVVVVRASKDDVALTCGGAPMVEVSGPASDGGAIDPDFAAGTLLGKRYADDERGIELLCTKAGDGSLAIDGRLVEVKSAKPLPSSD